MVKAFQIVISVVSDTTVYLVDRLAPRPYGNDGRGYKKRLLLFSLPLKLAQSATADILVEGVRVAHVEHVPTNEVLCKAGAWSGLKTDDHEGV